MHNQAVRGQQSIEQERYRAWDEFLEQRTNAGFRQSSWYTTLQVARGWGRFGTVLRHQEAIVGGAMVLTRSFAPESCYYYIPDGPVFLESDSVAEQAQVFKTILALIEQRRQSDPRVVSHLSINPRWEQIPSFVTGFQDSNHYYGSPRDTQCIDLRPPENAILAQMKPKGRYNIGVARRSGVSIIEDNSPRGIEDFVNIYKETFVRKGRRGRSSDYLHALVPVLLASERGSVFFAEYEGTRIATAVVVYFGRMATYYYGGSRDLHRNVMAPYLLQFEIMRNARNRGCEWYDLFGVSPQNEPRNAWTDISVFKRKFGGREIRLVQTLEYIYDPVAYEDWKVAEER
jgi:peptidoglycan pentaglycine glycine transferase (the first glycine)